MKNIANLLLSFLIYLLPIYSSNSYAVPKNLNNYEPEFFYKTNNLVRRSGAQEYYCGEKVILRGRIIDRRGVPVMGAKIYLWQAACDGKYPYNPLRVGVDKKMINLNNLSSFTGSGTTYSDNLGIFYFITAISPRENHISHDLNLRVIHKNLPQLDTKITLKDTNLYKYDLDKEYFRNYKTYQYDIVIDGNVRKKY